MKIGVVRFPGTNNEHETVRALNSFDNVVSEIIDHKETDKIGLFDGYWLAGGFSYADVLRAGAIASQSTIVEAIRDSAKPTIGVCNGYQILTEAGLLPGALIPNRSTRFICKWIHLKVTDHEFLSNHKDKVLKLPIAHFEGNLFSQSIEDVKNDFVKYSDQNGNVSPEFNPNGSIQNIAGTATKQFFGLMPHPERASFKHQGSTDGRIIIQGFIDEVKV